jgi:WS/DGAT/MGAT family acyltransferase
VIEGVEPGKWSIYMKVHHSQIDGVGGIRLMRRMLSVDPATRDMLPPWAIGTRGDQSGLPPRESTSEQTEQEIEHEQTSLLDSLTSQAATLAKSSVAVTGSLARTYAESVTGLGDADRAVPFRSPKTIFNGRIHTPRRFATQQYPIDRLKKIATTADASLNDVFLAVCGGALRRYLLERDALPDQSLTANVPVSVRPGDTPGVGNAITFLYASLGTDTDDPVERLHAVRDSTRLGKERVPEVNGIAMDTYTSILMLPFIGQAVLGFGGHGAPASNVVISNVPGPAEARYMDGSRLLQIYPISLLFNGQALNITAVSYDGQFNIGYTGCRDSVPSLQHIAVYSGEELERLESAVES